MSRYAVIYEHPEDAHNWSAYVPDLPGCVSVGDSLEECRQNVQEAIEFHIKGMLTDNELVPLPSTEVDYVEIA